MNLLLVALTRVCYDKDAQVNASHFTIESISSFSARGLPIAQFAPFNPGIDRMKTRSFPRLAREYSLDCFGRCAHLLCKCKFGELFLAYVMYCMAEMVILADAQGSLDGHLVDLAGDIGSARPESISG